MKPVHECECLVCSALGIIPGELWMLMVAGVAVLYGMVINADFFRNG